MVKFRTKNIGKLTITLGKRCNYFDIGEGQVTWRFRLNGDNKTLVATQLQRDQTGVKIILDKREVSLEVGASLDLSVDGEKVSVEVLASNNMGEDPGLGHTKVAVHAPRHIMIRREGYER